MAIKKLLIAFVNELSRKMFTVSAWTLGLNDPFVAGRRTWKRFSYLDHLTYKNVRWCLVDCGAFEGTFAQGFCEKLKTEKILLIEPNANLIETLQIKFPRALVLNAAVTGEGSEYVYYFQHELNAGQNYVNVEGGEGIRVKNLNLSKLIRDLQQVNLNVFIKLDIEGMELGVLNSLNSNDIDRLTAISLEVTPKSSASITLDYLANKFPNHYIYRETRFGWLKINIDRPHWSDYLPLFQNLILVKKDFLDCHDDVIKK